MYAKCRPRYDEGITQNVISRVTEKQFYLDIACGSGQLTNKLARHFQNAIGIDRSLEQLREAQGENIKYIAGSAFDLPVKSSSVDLVTVGQALHWLVPHDKFFCEVNRVLKIKGTFTAVGYRIPALVRPDLQENFDYFYNDILGSKKLPGEKGCFWDTNRRSVDNFYDDIDFPFKSTLQRLNYGVFHQLLINRIFLSIGISSLGKFKCLYRILWHI